MATRTITRRCLQLSSPHSPSAARTFLQLAPRPTLYTSPLHVLDFLLPNIPPSAISCGSFPGPVYPRSAACGARPFTSSTMRRTSAIFNPRKDDDGRDMNIEITPRAAKRLREIMSQDSNPDLALRIQVESGGCHGFQYLMSLTTLPSSLVCPGSTESECAEAGDGKIANLAEDDTVFAADDGTGAKVVMDWPSLELLKGSKIDYTMELIGSQFKIVDNPLATSSCGCGTSFDIKA